jgi:hypothetical protein
VRSYLKNKLDMVVHAYNPSYSGHGGKRSGDRSLMGEKCETIFEKQTKTGKAGAMVQVLKQLLSNPRF